MTIITITTVILFIILIIWSWHSLEDIEKSTKILYLIVEIAITLIITYVIFIISQGNIQYPSEEIENSIRTTLILLFAGVNGCILVPYTSKILAKVKQNEIDSKELRRKILVILVLIILIVLVEKNYMADTQDGILKVFNQLMEK
mgnify:FL=1